MEAGAQTFLDRADTDGVSSRTRHLARLFRARRAEQDGRLADAQMDDPRGSSSSNRRVGLRRWPRRIFHTLETEPPLQMDVANVGCARVHDRSLAGVTRRDRRGNSMNAWPAGERESAMIRP